MTILVSEASDGDRLDRVLAEALPEYSREYLKSLILQGNVLLNEKPVTKPSVRLVTGDALTIAIPETVPLSLEAEDIPLDVVYEDSDLLVINKPTGMLTHPAGPNATGTVVNALLHHCHGQLSGINGVERPGIVHRLDKDTSGLLMVAKTDVAHKGLQAQLQARTAKRRYRTIVQGTMPSETGVICAPIGRSSANRDKMTVRPDGREAVTRWVVIEPIGYRFSVLEVALETGRTHQIRVHMAHLGHPVFGDPLYGTGIERQLKFETQGQVLQAFSLTFTHPVTGAPMAFEIAPDAKYTEAKDFLSAREGASL